MRAVSYLYWNISSEVQFQNLFKVSRFDALYSCLTFPIAIASWKQKKNFLINSGLKKVRWQYSELFGMLCTTWLLSKGDGSRGIQYVLLEFIFLEENIL